MRRNNVPNIDAKNHPSEALRRFADMVFSPMRRDEPKSAQSRADLNDMQGLMAGRFADNGQTWIYPIWKGVRLLTLSDVEVWRGSAHSHQTPGTLLSLGHELHRSPHTHHFLFRGGRIVTYPSRPLKHSDTVTDPDTNPQ